LVNLKTTSGQQLQRVPTFGHEGSVGKPNPDSRMKKDRSDGNKKLDEDRWKFSPKARERKANVIRPRGGGKTTAMRGSRRANKGKVKGEKTLRKAEQE